VKDGDLSWADVYRVVPERTFKRRLSEGAVLKTAEADAIARLLRVSEMAAWAFRDKAKARVFLETANPALGNHVPWNMAQTDAGARDVEALLVRFVHGIPG
jgi:putative toxin-antitoxin system antitoxin component (TIGR02293 family)